MYVKRVKIITHCPEDGDDTTMDTISYQYRIYGENTQEMHVSNKGRDILRAFGWDPRKNVYVSETTDRILQQQGHLRLRGHKENYVEPANNFQMNYF